MAKFRRKMVRRKRTTRKGKGRKTVNVNRALAPFAQRYITKLKYAETVYINAAGPQAYRWSLNSLWDPNYTGIGHQPHGFDQLAALYNRYRVIKCNYAINAVDQSGQYITVAALPANQQVNAITLSEMRENPRCRYMTQAPNAAMKTLKGSVYLPSLVGRNKAQYMADDHYQSEVTTSPFEAALLNVYVQRLDEGLNVINVPFVITLTYTVEFFDVKNLGQS